MNRPAKHQHGVFEIRLKGNRQVRCIAGREIHADEGRIDLRRGALPKGFANQHGHAEATLLDDGKGWIVLEGRRTAAFGGR